MNLDRNYIFEQYQLINEVVLSRANIDRFVRQYNVSANSAADWINHFNKNSSYLKNKNIFSYKSIDDLEAALKQASETPNKQSALKVGSELVYENNIFKIYWIKNKTAAITLGRETSWCTAYDDRTELYVDPGDVGNMFYKYTLDYETLYYIIITDKETIEYFGKKVGVVYATDQGKPN